jgi:hypothetical protein
VPDRPAASHRCFLISRSFHVREGRPCQSRAPCAKEDPRDQRLQLDERFLELRAKRYLPAIYARLISLAQIERLMTLKEKRNAAAPATTH